ncbi:MAG: HAD-IIB family hydrolase [Candidatus Fimenecus sp.]
MRTLYITDLDGTFFDNSGTVSEESRCIINTLTQKGMLFSVATARSSLTVKDLLQGLHIPAPLVLMNGVFLYDLEKDEIVSFHEIAPRAFSEVVAAFQTCNKAPMLFLYGDDGQISVQYTRLDLQINRDFYHARKKVLGERFRRVDNLHIPERQHAVYVNLVDTYESLKPITELLEKIEGIHFSFYGDTYTEYWFLEVFSAEASKANGANEVKALVNADRLIAFGDNYNDVTLFAAADEAYAVENAVDELKAQATAVIESNEQDGVANFLLRQFSDMTEKKV